MLEPVAPLKPYQQAQREAESRSRAGFLPKTVKTRDGKTLLVLPSGALYFVDATGARRSFSQEPKKKDARRQRRRVLAYAQAALAAINPVLAAEAAEETTP